MRPGLIGSFNPAVIQTQSSSLYAADGGNITVLNVGGERWQVHTFYGSAYFQAYQELTDFQYLIVGGGGAGGSWYHGGGGGAGGLLTNIDGPSEVLPIGIYRVGVGTGGASGSVSGTPSSLVDSSDDYSIQAPGGGGGAQQPASAENGGSGGGSAGNSGGSIPGTGISGQGYGGGTGSTAPNGYGAGGGGGAGGAGAGGNNLRGGDGGIGRLININGTASYYAGGGGGSVYDGAPGVGGLGGGGSGSRGTGSPASAATDGIANTGGGGGGAERLFLTPGKGGSGIVIIRHRISSEQAVPPDGGTTIDIPAPIFNIFYDTSVAQSYPGSGTILYDLGTSETNATLKPQIVYSGGSLVLDGVTPDLIQFPAFNPNADFTVFFRIEISANTTSALLAPVSGGGGLGGLVFRYVPGTGLQIVRSFVAIVGGVAYTWSVGTDPVVALRRQGNAFRIYVNGDQVGSDIVASVAFNTSSPSAIGSDNSVTILNGKFKKFAYADYSMDDVLVADASSFLGT